jgi:hypothetical protein
MPCREPIFKVAVAQSAIIDLATAFGCVLEEYPVPLLVQGGDLDDTVPWRDQYCGYRMVTAPEKYLYSVARGGHYTFSDVCDLDFARLVEELNIEGAGEVLNDGCSPENNLPWKVAHTTINHYAIATLNLHLRDSPGSRDYLTQRSDPPFDVVTFSEGQVPDLPEACPAAP